MKTEINVGIIGFGTVGSGTIRTLLDNEASITQKVGAKLNVARVVVRDLAKPRAV